MSAGLQSFLKGSQLGGGKASNAIARTMKLFDQGEGEQKDGDLGLILKSLGGNNQLAGKAGTDLEGASIDPALAGEIIAQPGALTKDRQFKLTGQPVAQENFNLGSPQASLTPSDAISTAGRTDMKSPMIMQLLLDHYIKKGGY